MSKFDVIWGRMMALHSASELSKSEGWHDEFMEAEQAYWNAHKTYRPQELRDLQRMEIFEARQVH